MDVFSPEVSGTASSRSNFSAGGNCMITSVNLYSEREAVRRNRYGVSRKTLVRYLLSTIFYIALWRATGMWYGLPANFGEDGGAPDPTAMRVLLYSLIPLIGIYFFLEPRRVLALLQSASAWIKIVFFFCLTSIIVSVDPAASIKGLLAVLLLTTGVLLFRARYGEVETFNFLARFAIVTSFVNVLYTIAFPQFAIMGGSYAGMVKGAFYHKNLLGQFSAISIICLVSFRNLNPLVYMNLLRWISVFLFICLIIAARSSTAVVQVCIGISLLFGLRVIQRLPGQLMRSTFVLAGFVLLGLIISIAALGLAEVVAGAFGKDLTFSGRTNIWEALIPLIYERPLSGWGFAIFRQPQIMEQYVRITWDARSTHNTYLELALNIGLPGAIAWTIFVITRLLSKMASSPLDFGVAEARRREVVVILLVMMGAMTEAGMMLAPTILWPHMTIALSAVITKFDSNSFARRRPGV